MHSAAEHHDKRSDQVLVRYKARAERCLAQALSRLPDAAPPLREAMVYSALQGGKRLRAQLVYALADAGHCSLAALDPVVVAVELVHAYSLVHDDLPAMDDDALRRGQPSCHIKYGEALAILVGDALQSLAFAVLADTRHTYLEAPPYAPACALQLIRQLSAAIGAAGMVAGQVLDMQSQGQAADNQCLTQMHGLKTGALWSAAIEMAATVMALSPTLCQILRAYGEHLGLAFQIRDDILDVEGEVMLMGKHCGADTARQKVTYTAQYGLQGAKTACDQQLQLAKNCLKRLGWQSEVLQAITDTVGRRRT